MAEGPASELDEVGRTKCFFSNWETMSSLVLEKMECVKNTMEYRSPWYGKCPWGDLPLKAQSEPLLETLSWEPSQKNSPPVWAPSLLRGARGLPHDGLYCSYSRNCLKATEEG